VKDYQPLLDKFADGWTSFFTGKEYSGIPAEIENYFAHYWLDKLELDQIWTPIRKKIFPGEICSFPDHMFPTDFGTILRVGGSAIYSEKYYKCLQSCMEVAGDHNFVVVEDHADEHDRSSVYTTVPSDWWQAMHFKYPVTVSYQQIMRGEYLSEELMLMGDRDYFIFGDSGTWGIYAGDGILWSLHIVGFKTELSDTFNRNLAEDKSREKQIAQMLENAVNNISRLKRNQPNSF
jgi:hypothetical protein